MKKEYVYVATYLEKGYPVKLEVHATEESAIHSWATEENKNYWQTVVKKEVLRTKMN